MANAPGYKKIQSLLYYLAPVLEGEKLVCCFFLLCFIGLVEFILIPVAYWEAAVGSLSVFVVEN